MDFMIDSRDENLASTTESGEEIQALSLGFIRIICLLLTEDDTIPPERVAKLVSIFPASISTRSCYNLHHIIFIGINSYSDHEEVLEAIENEKNSLLEITEECQECQAESSLEVKNTFLLHLSIT